LQKDSVESISRIFTLNKNNQLLWRDLCNNAEHRTACRQSHV